MVLLGTFICLLYIEHNLHVPHFLFLLWSTNRYFFLPFRSLHFDLVSLVWSLSFSYSMYLFRLHHFCRSCSVYYFLSLSFSFSFFLFLLYGTFPNHAPHRGIKWKVSKREKWGKWEKEIDEGTKRMQTNNKKEKDVKSSFSHRISSFSLKSNFYHIRNRMDSCSNYAFRKKFPFSILLCSMSYLLSNAFWIFSPTAEGHFSFEK